MGPSSYVPSNAPHHHRRPLSPVSVGDVCNRINKVSFDNNNTDGAGGNLHHTHHARPRNRSAEPRHADKLHDTRPPSVNAIRSVVPECSQKDQLPICFRPDSGGTKGHPISIYTNHFKCHLPDNLAIVSLNTLTNSIDERDELCRCLEPIYRSCQRLQARQMVQCQQTTAQSF